MKSIKLSNFKTFDFVSIIYMVFYLLCVFLFVVVIFHTDTQFYISVILIVLCLIGFFNIFKFVFYRKKLSFDGYAISLKIDDEKIIVNYKEKNEFYAKTIDLNDIVEFKVTINSHLNMPGVASCSRMNTQFPLVKSYIKIITGDETIDIPVIYHSNGYSGSEYFMFPLLDESKKLNNFNWEVLGNGAVIMNETYNAYLENKI